MAGSGIWLDDATYLQTAGQLWGQEQAQRVQAGSTWAQQAMSDAIKPMQDTLGRLQQMVPAVPTTPVAPPPPTPPPAPAPEVTPAPPPMPTPPLAAIAPTPSAVGTTPIAQPPPAPAPPITPPAPLPTPVPSAASTNPGENWAQQQIQNLLNPSPAGPQTPAAPTGVPQAIPGLDTATPPPSAISGPSPTATAGPQPKQPGDLIDQTRQAASAAGIDPDTFSRQINQESGFNPGAQSPAGARGIAQFMPETARGLGVNPDDPNEALPGAAKLMRSYLDKYGGDWSKALAAYNAGPGNVDKYGGVPPFEETQRYVKTILGDAGTAIQGAAQQGLSAVNTAVEGVHAAVARQSQFGLGLSSGDAMSFCGPTAALAFAQAYGRNPTVAEAKQLAQQVGWDPSQGMAGPQSEVKLLKAMGVDAHMTSDVDWAQVGRDAQGGNPVIIDTPGHYYYVDGYNAQTGQLHVGTSGTDLKGGSEWMTAEQINGMPQSHGPARAAIFADHPLAQSDGLAQSIGQAAASPVGQAVGQVLGNVPLPMLGSNVNQVSAMLAQNAQTLQQGRDLVGNLLSPVQGVAEPLRAKADGILQAVQNVGSSALQSGQNVLQNALQSAQDTAAQVPQTVGGMLNQNALTAQGIPNVGGQALEGMQQVTPWLTGETARQMRDQPYSPEFQALAAQAAAAPTQFPTNPLEMLGGAGLGAPTSGEQLTREREQWIGEHNPLRDVPVVGGATTLGAQMALDPTNLLLGLPYGTRAAVRGAELAGPTIERALISRLPAQAEVGFAMGWPTGGRGPATGEGLLARALDQLGGYPAEIVGPIREWASQVEAPASQIASTVQRWMEENPLERMPATTPATVRATVSDLQASLGRGGGPPLPGGTMPGQLPLLGEQPYQPRMPEGAGPGGLPSTATDAATQQWLRELRSAETQRQFDQMQQAVEQAGLIGERTSTRTIGGQAVLPGMQPGAPVTWSERLRQYHVGNVIGDLATLTKVGLNSAINPAWSFATRGIADLATGNVSRAQGSALGAQTGFATMGDALAQGLRDVYTRPTSIANRATNPLDIAFARAWETPAALHSMLQSAGQNMIQRIEIGRLAGQEASARGLSGQPFVDAVAHLMNNPLPGWEDSARGIAQRAVLRGDLGTLGGYFANMAGQGGGAAGGARQAIGNVLFPVFRIGMNALTQGVEKSPLGAMGTAFDVARATTPLGRIVGEGPYAGRAFAQPVSSAVAPLSERLTNNIFGTAVSLWFAKMAADGTVTGNGPTDPGERRVLQSQGWQANSIRTPMGYVSYQGTPFEVPLGLAGEFADAIRNPLTPLEQQQSLAQTVAERLFAGTVEMLGSRTGLETIGQVWDLMHTAGTDVPTAMKQGGASLLGNVAGSYVPMAGLARGIARGMDPLMRQAAPGDIGQAIEANLPGLRQTLQPKTDLLGRAVANPQQGLGTLLPAHVGPGQENPILAAMGQAGVAPSATPQTVPYGPYAEIRLTAAERTLYDQYRGQVTQQAAGTMVQSPQWQQMPLKAQQLAMQQINSIAADAAGKMVLRDIGPAAQARMIPTGLAAPVQGYQPAGLGDLSQPALLRNQLQHQALLNSLLGGQTGLQGLQAANAAAAGVV